MKLSQFVSFFQDDAAEAEKEVYAEATQILDWMSRDYHAKFESWLNAEASKPFTLGPKLAESAMRVNTIREIQRHLARLKTEAMAARERIQEQ